MANKYMNHTTIKLKRSAWENLTQVMAAYLASNPPQDDDLLQDMIWEINRAIVKEMSEKHRVSNPEAKSLKLKLDAIQMLAFREMWSIVTLPAYEETVMRMLIVQVDREIHNQKFKILT